MSYKTAFFKFGGGGGGGIVTINYNLREYISSNTWNKPANLIGIELFMIGAGGGGASGSVRPSGTTSRAGSGGGSGGILWSWIDAANLSSSEPVVIGSGGTRGNSVSTNNTDGSSGGDGGYTEFGLSGGQALFSLRGGGGAQTGQGGLGWGVLTNLPQYYPHQTFGSSGSLSSSVGSNGSQLNNQSLFSTMVYPVAAAGGGVRSNGTPSGGGVGSGVLDDTMLLKGEATGGAAGGGNGVDGLSNAGSLLKAAPLMIELGLTGTYAYGSTGGGGGGSNTTNGGNAGRSGSFGAGGSGGGAALDGFSSGAGSAGAQGVIKILEVTYTVT